MSNWLKKLRIKRVSLVDKGANQEADIVLAKRDDSLDKASYASMEECMGALKDEAKCKELMAAMKRAETKETDMPEVTKADFEALQKRLEDSEAARKASDERLAKMEDEAIAKVYVEKAASFKGLPGVEPEKFAPILRKAYTPLTKDEQEALDKIFRAASDSIAASKLLDEVGTADQGSAEPYAKLEAMAKAYQKDHPDEHLTIAQAMAKVDSTPEGRAIYKRYDDEQRQKAARGR